MKTQKFKKKKSQKPVLITFKIDEWDLEQIKMNAKKYCFGSLSAWIRYSAQWYKPLIISQEKSK